VPHQRGLFDAHQVVQRKPNRPVQRRRVTTLMNSDTKVLARSCSSHGKPWYDRTLLLKMLSCGSTRHCMLTYGHQKPQRHVLRRSVQHEPSFCRILQGVRTASNLFNPLQVPQPVKMPKRCQICLQGFPKPASTPQAAYFFGPGLLFEAVPAAANR
jgi:hypothetical protein